MGNTTVTQTGTFRAVATDWGVDVTKNDYPRFVFHAACTAIWDAENEQWLDYTEMEEGIGVYLVLYGKDGKPFKNVEQIQKVFGWDGASFSALAQGDYTDVEFQIRVEDNDPEYAEKNPFQVAWLDVADAVPGGGGMRKLSDSELADLDRKMAVVLKKNASPSKPKPAAAKPASPKAKTAATEPVDPPTSAEEKMKRNRQQKEKDDAAKAKKAEAAAKKKAVTEAAEAKAADAGTAKKPMPSMGKPKKQAATMTGEEAWDAICNLQTELGEDCTDDMVNDALFDACKEVGGDDSPDTEQFTGEQWAAVAAKTTAALRS